MAFRLFTIGHNVRTVGLTMAQAEKQTTGDVAGAVFVSVVIGSGWFRLDPWKVCILPKLLSSDPVSK